MAMERDATAAAAHISSSFPWQTEREKRKILYGQRISMANEISTGKSPANLELNANTKYTLGVVHLTNKQMTIKTTSA